MECIPGEEKRSTEGRGMDNYSVESEAEANSGKRCDCTGEKVEAYELVGRRTVGVMAEERVEVKDWEKVCTVDTGEDTL